MEKLDLLDFSNKTILITGTTRGIGKELAKGFAQKGATVIMHGRRKDVLVSLAKEFKAEFVLAELSSRNDINNMIVDLKNRFKSIDVLINNAGVELSKPVEEFTMSEYDNIFNINLHGIFQLTTGIFDLLKNAKGASVIQMSSIHERLPYPTNSVYCMTKAALAMFCKVVGVEWAPYNIRVNSLAPGAILTDMNREVIDNIGRGKFSSWIGSGKIGSTTDVLNACFFLASEMSSYMTGETLFLDGALSAGLLPYGKTPAMEQMQTSLRAKDE